MRKLFNQIIINYKTDYINKETNEFFQEWNINSLTSIVQYLSIDNLIINNKIIRDSKRITYWINTRNNIRLKTNTFLICYMFPIQY